MSRFKLIKKTPKLYKMLKPIYWKIQELTEKFWGTRIQEKKWAERHLREGKNWIVKGYWEGRDHSHRQFLLKRIENFAPFSGVLEIGCNCGPDIYLIAKKFPKVKIKGIDINPEAVKIGNELFIKEGISNVELFTDKADDLSRFPDKSFDIVFTDATLIYIGPDKIKKVISEMVRISKKGIILLEHHDKTAEALGTYNLGFWKRDYQKLLAQFIPEDQIRCVKLPKELWQDKDWEKLGYIIEVRI